MTKPSEHPCGVVLLCTQGANEVFEVLKLLEKDGLVYVRVQFGMSGQSSVNHYWRTADGLDAMFKVVRQL